MRSCYGVRRCARREETRTPILSIRGPSSPDPKAEAEVCGRPRDLPTVTGLGRMERPPGLRRWGDAGGAFAAQPQAGALQGSLPFMHAAVPTAKSAPGKPHSGSHEQG